MKKITLNILAQDINETDYVNGRDCAITRALKRGGYNYFDDGLSIVDDTSREEIVDYRNDTYQILCDKVLGMYSMKDRKPYEGNNGIVEQLPIKNFKHVIILE